MSERMMSLGIDRLSPEDRALLVQEIMDSIAAEQEQVRLTGAERAELERRIAAHRADPADVIPWEQIKADALGRFHGVCNRLGVNLP